MAKGRKTGGGSRKGIPNKRPSTASILAAVVAAAQSHEGGMTGYLTWLKANDPKAYTTLLNKGMAIQEQYSDVQVNQTVEVVIGGED